MISTRWICGLSVALIWLTGSCADSGDENSVMEGGFELTLVEKGELEAIDARWVYPKPLSNVSAAKVLWLVEHGTIVQKGDTIVRFDSSPVETEIRSAQSSLETLLAARQMEEIAMENSFREAKSQWANAQSAFDLSKLQLERAKFDTEKQRMIAELRFQQSLLRLQKSKNSLEQLPVLQQCNKMISDIQIDKGRRRLQTISENLSKLALTAPVEGYFQLSINPSSRTTRFKVGDNVYSTYAIASIPDLSRMKVKTSVREVDITKISVGMDVRVRLDALPSVFFKGVVTDISKVCLRDGNGVKSFGVVVELTDCDERLKPGMTVNCEYVCYRSEKDLFVPNSCLLRSDTASYLFKRRGSRLRRIEVTAGASNNHYTVVRGDVKAGEALVPLEEALGEGKF